jgi:hypothetical protein
VEASQFARHSRNRVEIGPGLYHTRKIGDLLHPARESEAVLDDMKIQMGSATFSAQYQQSPIPPGGNMIDWNWFRWFEPDSELAVDDVVISWDTAMKATELADYSVGMSIGTQSGPRIGVQEGPCLSTL